MPVLRKTRRNIVIASALFTLTAVPSFAIFGLGDVVFDPSVYAQAIAQGLSAANTLTAIENNLRSFSFKQLWQTTQSSLRQASVRNRFGETNGWSAALNTDSPASAASAWSSANIPLDPTLTSSAISRTLGASASLAMIEALDSISPDCLNTIGQYRALRAQNATAETSLEQQQLDSSPATNSEIEQLNLLNASEAQKMTELQAQGIIGTCLAAQATVANMQQRNAAVQDLNDNSFVQQEHLNNPVFAENESGTWTTYLP